MLDPSLHSEIRRGLQRASCICRAGAADSEESVGMMLRGHQAEAADLMYGSAAYFLAIYRILKEALEHE